MTAKLYKVGDWVTIKQWDQMVEEYGYIEDVGIILFDGRYFNEDMRFLCGNSYKICRLEDRWWAYYGTQYILDKVPLERNQCVDEMIAHNFRYGEEVEARYSSDSSWRIDYFRWFDFDEPKWKWRCKNDIWSYIRKKPQPTEPKTNDEKWDEEIKSLNERLDRIEELLKRND